MRGSARLGDGFATLRQAIGQAGPLRLIVTGLVLLLALLMARYSWNLPLALAAERGLYDVRADLTAPRVDQDDRVVLVVFTEETLAATGKRSPLDRTMLARALTNLDALGPRAIGVDILIDQPQPEDPALTAALKAIHTPTWFGFSSNAENGEFIMPWQEAHMRAYFAGVANAPVRTANIRLDVDSDNAWRQWPRPARQPPPLLVNAITGVKGYEGHQGSVRLRRPQFADRPVFASLPIDLFGNAETAAALKDAIAGKIVLVGADLPEVDRFITPFTRLSGQTTPGVELHAVLIAQALDGAVLTPLPSAVMWALALAAVLLGALTGGFDASARLLIPFVIVEIFALGWLPYGLAGQGYDTYGLPCAGLGVGWLLALMAASTMARIVGAEQRRFAQGALGKYLPRDVAQQILREPERLQLSGERRPVFALFSDIEGFTSMCQSQPPEVVASTLNEYLDTMSEVVLKHGGTLDKFVADAVVAFWGAPIARDDDARRALACAVEMVQAGERFRIAEAGRPAMGRTRVGLHWGDVVVGNFGGEGRIQYTALGDAMNVAARLEGANKSLKTAALVSREAAEQMGLDRFRAMGRVRVRGREKPIDVFEPLALASAGPEQAGDALLAAIAAGDGAALAALRQRSAAAPQDTALAYLVRRLEQVGPGGVYDLD
ncbi:adenylate/guanylate cyclase domain-containing protein [Sandarakinorhabdus rubra]|uniref:adenylate/guanylate cyclase domain-containing protein n=1 Tax=Sandarakinorhabdus rubra TaxID=2672568 RepID=UPI001F32220A|nr:adenylate/guanylate cyclase domain-containing protein [Sandarakinorhabdus rubra]